jgi:adenylate cyclase class 2
MPDLWPTHYDPPPGSDILGRMPPSDEKCDTGSMARKAGLERRNLELKARLESLDIARQRARELATDQLGHQLQQDTYFHCREGRLKLRSIDAGPAQLISYARPDCPDAALSRYHLVEIPDSAGLERALAAALGIWVVVCKRREIYLYHNVRIHLDQVDGLGVFLEFEAVLGPDADEPTSRERLDFLSRQFDLTPNRLLKESYSDMLGGKTIS